MRKKIVNPGPAAQMIAHLESTMYAVLPEVGHPTIKIIRCRHCPFDIRYDDANLEQAEASSIVFLKHFKTAHPKVLASISEVRIDL